MLLFVTFIYLSITQMVWCLPNPKIAIVGGGIGGTSCAYFLKKAFAGNISLSLFERDIIGGRLRTINVNGDHFEAGGSVIHPKNKYLLHFAKLLGLTSRKPHPSLWGIYNGEQFVFKDSQWSLVTLARLFWRYGWDVFRLNTLVSSLLNEFNSIYSLQKQGLAFTTVNNLLDHMSPRFPNMTQQTLSSFMKKAGFSELFLSELVQAVMLVNYGQTTDINAFAGAVSLAGSESGLWSIQGGNKLVPMGLLGKSEAAVINGDVTDVTLQENGAFSLTYRDTLRNDNDKKTETYDVVVIASPLITGSPNIKFRNFSKDFSKYEGVFHRTVSTFIKGNLKSSAFEADSESIPDAILTNNDSYFFNSVGHSWPVSGNKTTGENVYKVFSQKPLSEDEIKLLFSDVQSVKVKDWKAYPDYHPPEIMPPFMLYPGLYYTNAIEWSASAMEMSAIAGKNVALLVYNTWTNKIDLIDQKQRVYKEEL